MSKELNDFINERTEGDLVMLCNEIYDWNATENISEDSYIYGISRDFSCSPNHVKELVLDGVCRETWKNCTITFRGKSI